ncbi:hypothetical protein RISK_005844 [Rhodopirellula islandica]|uniref:Uncharacterized protein n=1 Tax=Rhodopirellula islandica TaxID=595434 RepID=A0A0J1E9N0_RHOIS|nr:hypothetical protein RISK_005844 [Rhodopirellula islandica]
MQFQDLPVGLPFGWSRGNDNRIDRGHLAANPIQATRVSCVSAATPLSIERTGRGFLGVSIVEASQFSGVGAWLSPPWVLLS